MTVRAAELTERLTAVRARIVDGCVAAGRDPAAVTLVVVTKTYPADDVRLLAELGVTDVGESRDQEAAAKAADSTDLGLRWHFVGQLQTNKARSVASYADFVHSVDRVPLVRALGKGARSAGRTVECFVQASLDAHPDRGGAEPDDVAGVAAAVAAEEGLELRGLMAVAPQHVDPLEAFGRLQRMSQVIVLDHPAATAISAGMSGDIEAALACGATHLRVGSAVLGTRPPLGYLPNGG